jgi:hypothetical protein
MTPDTRLVLFHKQGTSARTRFLRFADSLLAFASLPEGAVLRAESESQGTVLTHPAPVLKQAEDRLGLPPGSLLAEAEFSATVDTPQGAVQVLLAGFTTIDPPFAAANDAGGRFIAITEARGLPPIELELARRAYTAILG